MFILYTEQGKKSVEIVTWVSGGWIGWSDSDHPTDQVENVVGGKVRVKQYEGAVGIFKSQGKCNCIAQVFPSITYLEKSLWLL